MIEASVARLRTSRCDIVVVDMPLEQALDTYRQIVDEDRGTKVAPNLYAEESLLVNSLPVIESRGTVEAEVSRLLEEGRDVLDSLAQRHRSRIWRMPHRGNVEAVHITFEPWIFSEPLDDMGEAIRVARGIQTMDNETFIDYTRR